jgi:hypothetical protein
MAEKFIGVPGGTLQSSIGLRVATERGEVFNRATYRDAIVALESMAADNGKRLAELDARMLRTVDPQETEGLRAQYQQLAFEARRVGETLTFHKNVLDHVAPEAERTRKAELKAALGLRKALAAKVTAAKDAMTEHAATLREAREVEAKIAKLGGTPHSVWTGEPMPLQGGDDGAPPLALYDAAGRALDLGPSSLMTMPSVGDRVKLEATVDTGIPPALPAGLPIHLAAGEAVVATLGLDGAAMLASARGLKIWRVE